ncbi:MAG: hypothetical protein IT223_12060 [Crocinitomicaceae bacterium]|nr:hypothetical protein [Crocinitomicaceae bacterium]
MKNNFFITLFFCFMGFVGFSQNSLTFSKVLLVGATETTVPAGYVWKIAGLAGAFDMVNVVNRSSSTPSSIISTYSYYDHPQILINQLPIDIGNVSVGAGGGSGGGNTSTQYSTANTIYSNMPTTLPLWLPESTTLQASFNINYISVIEFKVQ